MSRARRDAERQEVRQPEQQKAAAAYQQTAQLMALFLIAILVGGFFVVRFVIGLDDNGEHTAERTSVTADADGIYHATFPAEVERAIQLALKKYPSYKRYSLRDWNLLPASDFDRQMVEEARASYGLQANDASWGDLNGDGKEDYVLFIVKRSPDKRKPMRIVTVGSRKDGGFDISSPCESNIGPTAVMENREDKFVIVGPLESDATLVVRWNGSRFVCE